MTRNTAALIQEHTYADGQRSRWFNDRSAACAALKGVHRNRRAQWTRHEPLETSPGIIWRVDDYPQIGGAA